MSVNSDRQDTLDSLRGSVSALQNDVHTVLERLIAIPSLSKPGSDPAVLEQSVNAVRDIFAPLLAWNSIDIVRAPGGAPALLARKDPAPGFPTVLLYAHHDVQPTGDEGLWTSPPFVATERQGRLYGRGSADDGAGIVTHYAAIRALSDRAGGAPGLGVVVFIEGEEESGSPTFATLLQTYASQLAADVIVVADSDNPAPDRPALTTSLRGVLGVTLTVRTLESARHSGLFGGPTPDAVGVLVRVLNSCWAEDGSVAIAGVQGVAARESGAIAEDTLRAEAGILPGIELWGQGDISRRLWRQPALTVTGMDVPRVAEASNTLIPQASARLSLRIPPGVPAATAQSALESHLREHAPPGVLLELSNWEAGEGVDQSPEHVLLGELADCLSDAYGNPVDYQGVGGTIPFVAHLAERFPDVPIAITGVEDRQSAAHGIDESVDLSMLERAGLAEGLFLTRLEESRIQDASTNPR